MVAVTYRHLWPRVIAWENRLAACHRWRRRKRYKAEALRFDFEWESLRRQV